MTLLAPLLPTVIVRQLNNFWLFERSTRPNTLQQQLQLLEWILQSSHASEKQRHYALVAISYRAVDCGDVDLAADCLSKITVLVAAAAERCLNGDQRGSNRENPAKWLVSLHTTAYHLGLAIDDYAQTLLRLRDLDAVITEQLIKQLDNDVACRITSNLMRCFSLSWLEAWHIGDCERMQC